MENCKSTVLVKKKNEEKTFTYTDLSTFLTHLKAARVPPLLWFPVPVYLLRDLVSSPRK